MLIGGIALGLILGLLVGGSITNLATVRLHRLPLLFVAVIVRFGTEFLLNAHVPLAETLRVPLLGTSFALLLVALWANRGYPGMSLAFIGVLANAVVILVNGGYMPIYLPSLLLAGLHPADVTTVAPHDHAAGARRHRSCSTSGRSPTSSRSPSRSSRTSRRSATSS